MGDVNHSEKPLKYDSKVLTLVWWFFTWIPKVSWKRSFGVYESAGEQLTDQ